jgi:hypothetical protein
MDSWSHDWLWGLPLIVLTVVAHAFGLVGIRGRVLGPFSRFLGADRSLAAFALAVSVTVLVLTALHGLEATAWAVAYTALAASPDARTAMLYSLSAMTSYGHATVYLEPDWRLMGAMEALNGMMLFGLTTAFLFSVLGDYWPSRRSHPDDPSRPARIRAPKDP